MSIVFGSIGITFLFVILLIISIFRNKRVGMLLTLTLLTLGACVYLAYSYVIESPANQSAEVKESPAAPISGEASQPEARELMTLGELNQFKKVSTGWIGPVKSSENQDVYADSEGIWHLVSKGGGTEVKKIVILLPRLTESSLGNVLEKMEIVDKEFSKHNISGLARVGLLQYIKGYGTSPYQVHEGDYYFTVDVVKSNITIHKDVKSN